MVGFFFCMAKIYFGNLLKAPVMQYQKFHPQKILSPFVECYFVWESEEPLEKELAVESPPNGFCSLVINYGDPYFLQNKKYERLSVPQQFVSGQSIYTYKLFLQGKIGIAGIVFKPAALTTLFNLDSFEFTEERIDLFKALPQSYIKKYIELVKQADSAVEKVKLLEELLLHHYNLTQPEPDYIDKAANMIVEQNGMLHVQHLLK